MDVLACGQAPRFALSGMSLGVRGSREEGVNGEALECADAKSLFSLSKQFLL